MTYNNWWVFLISFLKPCFLEYMDTVRNVGHFPISLGQARPKEHYMPRFGNRLNSFQITHRKVHKGAGLDSKVSWTGGHWHQAGTGHLWANS